MKTIGYLPVSTDQQAERGVGLDAQRTAIGVSLLTSMGPRFLRMIPPRVPPPRVR